MGPRLTRVGHGTNWEADTGHKTLSVLELIGSHDRRVIARHETSYVFFRAGLTPARGETVWGMEHAELEMRCARSATSSRTGVRVAIGRPDKQSLYVGGG